MSEAFKRLQTIMGDLSALRSAGAVLSWPHDPQPGFFATLHEAGHGMHSQGIPAALAGTPLVWTRSLGIGESQSRLWENVSGRSRGFWEHFLRPASGRIGLA